jgi:hypothetical protein
MHQVLLRQLYLHQSLLGNGFQRSASVYNGSCPRWLATVSHLSHGRNSWPLTPSRVWLPLATTCFRLRTRLCQSPNWLFLHSLCTDPTESTAPNSSSIVTYDLLWQSRDLVAVQTCLQSYCLATDVFSGSTALALGLHVTVCMYVWTNGWTVVRLACSWTVGRILFIFGIQDCIHTSVLGEYKHSTSKNRDPLDRPPKTTRFSRKRL